ncbi:MAG TPA: hypothetical protein VH394_15090 [Thermoanaerobaculia bacterium]|nr:hypothetical protein [Thermoanaerobaculia bacterium]
MSGSTLRRTVLCLLVVALLLPLASAYAAPAKRSETRVIQLTDLGRMVMRSVNEFLSLFRPMTEQDAPMPPGQMPSPVNREGNGLDPHGRP